MLEQQHFQLVAGLTELYKRTLSGQGWPGAPVDVSEHGAPLVHMILDRLGVLRTHLHYESPFSGKDFPESGRLSKPESVDSSRHSSSNPSPSTSSRTSEIANIGVSLTNPTYEMHWQGTVNCQDNLSCLDGEGFYWWCAPPESLEPLTDISSMCLGNLDIDTSATIPGDYCTNSMPSLT